MLVQLRDGRKIYGMLRSFDQFSNLVFEHAVERIIVGKKFADAPLGLYIIRGENIVLMGQIDNRKEEKLTQETLTEVPLDEILAAKREADDEQKLKANLARAATRAANDPWDEGLA